MQLLSSTLVVRDMEKSLKFSFFLFYQGISRNVRRALRYKFFHFSFLLQNFVL